jgi:serine/threonine protein kinase
MSAVRSFPFPRYLSHRHPCRAQAAARRRDSAIARLPRIPGYRVQRKLGEGRMATVYLARDMARGGLAVLKVLRREHAGSEVRSAAFSQEFTIPALVRNEHVIRVYDQFAGGGQAAIAMEYVGGGDLRQRIRTGLAADAALALLRQAAAALDALHRRRFVHRDVKPANLLLRSGGELVLADFGLARRLDAPHTPPPAGQVIGTPCYAAPEQSQGLAVGSAADVYSLGVVFYEMLCGKPPFPGDTVMEVYCQHLMAPVPRLPGELDRFQPLVDAMLAKQVQSRLQDGRAILRQIDLIQDAASLRPAQAAQPGSRCLK